MRLPNPPPRYDASIEAQRNATIEQADAMSHKRGVDLVLGKERLIVQSPNGTRFVVTVTDLGVLGVAAL